MGAFLLKNKARAIVRGKSEVLLAAALLLLGTHAHAAQAQCLTDAEIEAKLGRDVRAGKFALNTQGLNDRPLCSGLTLAQRIQQMADAALPDEKRKRDGISSTTPRREATPSVVDVPASVVQAPVIQQQQPVSAFANPHFNFDAFVGERKVRVPLSESEFGMLCGSLKDGQPDLPIDRESVLSFTTQWLDTNKSTPDTALSSMRAKFSKMSRLDQRLVTTSCLDVFPSR